MAVLVVGAGIALAVTSGGNTKKASQGRRTSRRPTTTAASGPVCPLTGLPAPGGQVPQRPALAVKVDNYPEARPQSGLGQADIVFDEPVEGRITRFVAVFQCQSPTLIGPIRSARAVDLQILDQLSKPILVHVGGIDPVLSLLRDGNLIDYDLRTHGSIIQNVPGRYAPYDTYISAAAGWGLDPGYKSSPAPIFTYSTTAPSGTPITSVHIPFSGTNNALWTWSATSGRWLLSYSGVPATVERHADRHDQRRGPDRARHLRPVARERRGWPRGAVADDRERSAHGAAQRGRRLRDLAAGLPARHHDAHGIQRLAHRTGPRSDVGRDRALHRGGHDHHPTGSLGPATTAP